MCGRCALSVSAVSSLARADRFEDDFVKSVDEFIAKNGLDAPEEVLHKLGDSHNVEQLQELDLEDANINTVIWATGYAFDFSIVQIPVFDQDGYPVGKRGITAYPGLYFIGLPWLHNAKSGLLFGVGQDAAHIAADINRGPQQRRTHKIAEESIAA